MSDWEGPAVWLALNRLRGLGPRLLQALEAAGIAPPALLNSPLPPSLEAGLPLPLRRALADARRGTHSTLWPRVQADRAWLTDTGTRLVTWDRPEYPAALTAIADPPPVLFVRGDVSVLARRQIAIVGSRSASASGRDTAKLFARRLADHGLAVTSGLARGVDGAAHRGALEAPGYTVAVLASGLDRLYPRQHENLAEAILAGGGALVSEFSPGTEPRRGLFPRRNRLISGLAMGVLVVEAARRSGSLVTARLAMEQGREVFAVPGSIHRPQSRGCHRLIREGAVLTETVDDILTELGGFLGESPTIEATPATDDAPLTGTEACLEKLLEPERPQGLDELVTRSALSATEVSRALVRLELAGRVTSEAGGYTRRVTVLP